LWWFNFKLNPRFATAPAASKNDTHYKSGQNILKNNHLATLILISETDCMLREIQANHWSHLKKVLPGVISGSCDVCFTDRENVGMSSGDLPSVVIPFHFSGEWITQIFQRTFDLKIDRET
jgi:hypothetical protein